MQTEGINLSVIPQEELTLIKQGLLEIKEALSKKTEEELSASYIESKLVPKLLGISQKTWQTYRDRRTIPFIQFGSKIWVKRKDIDSFLNSHYISNK
ncbi:hypothetical protein AEM51_13085 [Bacteroidetes bacterium UKL13-3]|nr:hypothetical protein AEM51_13085 [Bacteroidetes bacterium UKL13-3]HCP93135.1 DNA-binding protein [Bacteroidota bacterium]